jgi:hypothetical protein
MSALSGEKEATQAKHKRKYVWILPVKTNKISKKVNSSFLAFLPASDRRRYQFSV